MAQAQRIKSDEQALEAVRIFTQQIRGESAARDRERRLPFEEIELFSETGLWGIAVPKRYGGAGVSTSTFTEVVAIVSEADASIGQIPQNHYANVEEIRLIGTEAQKKFFFDRILKGERLGNAAVERSGKNVVANQTQLVPDGDGYRLSGEKFYCTDPLTIQELGKLQYQLHVAEALMEKAAVKVDRAASVLDEETVTGAALAVAEAKIAATEISIQATNKLFELAGTQSTLDKHGFDRHWRNARVHTLHDPVRWKYYAVWGTTI
jgi:alkylation response protein AidB-like acyl-CoA dehydrogenase